MVISLVLSNAGTIVTVKVNLKMWNHAKNAASSYSSHYVLWKAKDCLHHHVQHYHGHNLELLDKTTWYQYYKIILENFKDVTEIKHKKRLALIRNRRWLIWDIKSLVSSASEKAVYPICVKFWIFFMAWVYENIVMRWLACWDSDQFGLTFSCFTTHQN